MRASFFVLLLAACTPEAEFRFSRLVPERAPDDAGVQAFVGPEGTRLWWRPTVGAQGVASGAPDAGWHQALRLGDAGLALWDRVGETTVLLDLERAGAAPQLRELYRLEGIAAPLQLWNEDLVVTQQLPASFGPAVTAIVVLSPGGVVRHFILPPGFLPAPGERITKGRLLLERQTPIVFPGLEPVPYRVAVGWLELATGQVRFLAEVEGQYRPMITGCCNVAPDTTVGFGDRAGHHLRVDPGTGQVTVAHHDGGPHHPLGLDPG